MREGDDGRGDGEVKWKVRGMRGGMETNVYM